MYYLDKLVSSDIDILWTSFWTKLLWSGKKYKISVFQKVHNVTANG